MRVQSGMSEDGGQLSGDQKATPSKDDADEDGRSSRLAAIENGVRRINPADRQ
jgi:hypothetical protein